ncbi:uncharacterized protein LOC115990458 [Quercus lobata]|uniref:uncharacterized protein LOC115990458 n=1 Tax=Quercus lobata TaxID=97700 RepID=UPI0012485B15|nr:uncharacterized protein LOC115990458 [Quercus lobata]
MFNEIDGDFDDMTISTFKVGLPAEHSLRKSLTGKPVISVCQLMDRIDKYKRVEEDQQLGKGKAKGSHLHHSTGQGSQIGSEPQRDTSSRPPPEMINVIFAAPGKTDSCPSRVMSVARLSAKDNNLEPKKARMDIQSTLSFSNEDKIGTIQSHDDALVVTLKIGGYDVKRVMVDQGSGAEIMYPDLYKGLNLRPKDLTAYNSPLVSFDGKIVIPRGLIRLLVQASSEVVEVNFIVVDIQFYNLYLTNR